MWEQATRVFYDRVPVARYMIEILRQDYIRTARAKGLAERSVMFPGLALTLAGLSLNLLGDGLRDTLDPRLRVE